MTFRALIGKFIEFKAKAAAAPSRAGRLPATPAAEADFAAIYRQAGIAVPAFSAEKALSILMSLPADLSEEARSRVFRETLRVIANDLPELVARDAKSKIAALSASISDLAKRSAAYVAAKDAEIKALEGQIKAIAQAVQVARAQERQQTDRYQAEGERLKKLQQLLAPQTG